MSGDTLVAIAGVLMALVLVGANGGLRRLPRKRMFGMVAIWVGIIVAAAIFVPYYWLVYNRAVRTMHFDQYYVGKLPVPHPGARALNDIVELVKTVSDEMRPNPQTSLTGKAASIQRGIDMKIFDLFELTLSEAELILASVGEQTERSNWTAR
ncbi:MAG: hypothetical protein IH997_01180 [Proteobacteria bacterium]|nr:hypothetical protein [Pseudomonadota bacterium]